jgi:hypothetical protein
LPRIDPPSKQSPFVILSEAPGLNFLCEIDGRGAEGSMHFLFLYQPWLSRNQKITFRRRYNFLSHTKYIDPSTPRIIGFAG